MAERTLTVRLKALIGDYQAALEKARSSTGRAAKSIDDDLKKVGRSASDFGSDMTRKVSLPLTLAGIGAGKLSSDFETVFTRMSTLAGVPADALDDLKSKVLDLARSTGRGPQELAEALYFASSAGYDAATAMDIVEASAKAAAVGLGSTEDIVNATTNALGAYGTANLDAAKATDILLAAARVAKIEASQIGPQLGRILPIANLLGVSYADVAGAVAYLSQSNGDASLSATMLAGALQKMLTPSDQGRKTLAEFGTSAEELQQTIRSGGLGAALELLRRRFGDNSAALFKVFEDVQAFNGVAQLLANTNGNLSAALEQTNGAAGEVGKAFAQVSETDAQKLRQAMQTLAVFIVRVGNVVTPVAASLTTLFSPVLDAFGAMPEFAQSATVGLLGILVAVGPITSGLGKIAENLDTIRRVGFRAFDSIAFGGGGFASNMAKAGLAVGGVSAAALIATAVFKHYADEKARMAKLTDDFTQALKREQEGLTGETSATIGSRLLEGGLGEKLRAVGVNIALFTDGIKGSSAEVAHLADLAEKYGTHSGGLFVKALEEGAAAGDPFAVELKRIRDSGVLSNGELKTLAMRTKEASTAWQYATRDTANAAYANDAAGKSAATTAGSMASLAAEVSGVGGTAQTTAEAIAALVGEVNALYSGTFAVGDAEQSFADALADATTSTTSAGGATRNLAKDARELERATRSVATAQDELRKAEDELRLARQGPTARELKDAELDNRSAILGVAEAAKRLKDASAAVRAERKKGKDGDVAGAILSEREATIALERAKLAASDASENLRKVQDSGLPTSEKVRDATDRVTSAQDALIDAEQRVIDLEESQRGDAATGGPLGDKRRAQAAATKAAIEKGRDWITTLLEEKRPASEVTTVVDNLMRAMDELETKNGDANGQLEKFRDFLREILNLAKGLPDIGSGLGGVVGGVIVGPDGSILGDGGLNDTLTGTAKLTAGGGTVSNLTASGATISAAPAGPPAVAKMTASAPLNVVLPDGKVLASAVVEASYDGPGLDLKIRKR